MSIFFKQFFKTELLTFLRFKQHQSNYHIRAIINSDFSKSKIITQTGQHRLIIKTHGGLPQVTCQINVKRESENSGRAVNTYRLKEHALGRLVHCFDQRPTLTIGTKTNTTSYRVSLRDATGRAH